ncbi:phosphatase PAP2 family protein [Mycoplasma sp. P36-A1]|uniref:phosphatase PAP2 family protein n=1 Tax=Mycoplasma sp. P36-A1 TaxID=3252900 RepID=UPI003C2ECD08
MDYQITNWIYGMHNAFSDPIFKIITYSGNLMLIWIIITLVLLIKTKKLNVKSIIYLNIIPIVLSLFNEYGLKTIIERKRPFIQYEKFVPLIMPPHGSSMPSGHSLSSFLMATILSYYFPKYKIPLYILATMISLSRVYVGVHYFSDVLVGSALGVIFAIIYLKILKRYTVKI